MTTPTFLSDMHLLLGILSAAEKAVYEAYSGDWIRQTPYMESLAVECERVREELNRR